MKYVVKFTKQFKKDLKLAKRQKKDIEKLYELIKRLANGEKIEDKYQEHDLLGNYAGCKECHISPDWLLIYEFSEASATLSLDRVGSHSDLF